MHLVLRDPTVSCHYHIKSLSSTVSQPEKKRSQHFNSLSIQFSHGAIWMSIAGDADTHMQTHTHTGRYSAHACIQAHTPAIVLNPLWFIFLFVMKITRGTPRTDLDPLSVCLCFMNILIQIPLCFQTPGQASPCPMPSLSPSNHSNHKPKHIRVSDNSQDPGL